jgi:hypothetical protein
LVLVFGLGLGVDVSVGVGAGVSVGVGVGLRLRLRHPPGLGLVSSCVSIGWPVSRASGFYLYLSWTTDLYIYLSLHMLSLSHSINGG